MCQKRFLMFFVFALVLLSCTKAYHGVNEYKGFKLGEHVFINIEMNIKDYKHYGFKRPPEFQFSILAIQPFPNLKHDEHFNACFDDDICLEYAKKMAKFGGWVEVPTEYIFSTPMDDETYKKNVRAIIILNKKNKIIGIYPNKNMQNIDEIMNDFPQYSKPLPEFKKFKFLQELEEMAYEFQQAVMLKPTSQNINDLEKLRKMEENLKSYQLKNNSL